MNARIIKKAEASKKENYTINEDEFLTTEDFRVNIPNLKENFFRITGEISELSSKNKWTEIIDIFYPVEDKLPEFTNSEFQAELRSKLSFALNQLGKFDEAIAELQKAVEHDPDKFIYHHNLAYTAYNSLYSAKNRKIFLRGNHKKERIELAKKHFQAAFAIRPDTITNFYRMGMLIKEIENKPLKSFNYFHTAVKNWEKLDEQAREKRHQEKKNYIKSLYQLASALLKSGKVKEPYDYLTRCIEEDKQTDYIMPQNKYFALGKIFVFKGDYKKAVEHLETALEYSSKKEDFIIELLARSYFFGKNTEKALKIIQRLDNRWMKPYCRWTKADILCSLKRLEEAENVLSEKLETDTKSRHKTLIRLAKINYLKGSYKKCLEYSILASQFYSSTWQNTNAECLYWECVSLYRLGKTEKAMQAVLKIKKLHPGYQNIHLVEKKIKEEIH